MCRRCNVYNMFARLPEEVAFHPTVLHRGTIVTMVSAVVAVIALGTLISLEATTQNTMKVTVTDVGEGRFHELRAAHPSVECPCTKVFQKYGDVASHNVSMDSICDIDADKAVAALNAGFEDSTQRIRGRALFGWLLSFTQMCDVSRSFLSDTIASLDNTTFTSVIAGGPSSTESLVMSHYQSGLSQVRRQFTRIQQFQKSHKAKNLPVTLLGFEFVDRTFAGFEADYPRQMIKTMPGVNESERMQWTFPPHDPHGWSYKNPNSPSNDARYPLPHGVDGSLTPISANHSIGRVVLPNIPHVSIWWETIRVYNGTCDCLSSSVCSVRFCDIPMEFGQRMQFMWNYLGMSEYNCITIECTLDDWFFDWPTKANPAIPLNIYWAIFHSVIVREELWPANLTYEQAWDYVHPMSRELGNAMAGLGVNSEFRTIRTASHAMFIHDDDFKIHFNYTNFYSTCNPSHCTYIEKRPKSMIEILQVVAAFGGGIAAIARVGATISFRIWLRVSPVGESPLVARAATKSKATENPKHPKKPKGATRAKPLHISKPRELEHFLRHPRAERVRAFKASSS